MVKSWIFAAVVVAVLVSSVVFLGGYGFILFLFFLGFWGVYQLEQSQNPRQDKRPN